MNSVMSISIQRECNKNMYICVSLQFTRIYIYIQNAKGTKLTFLFFYFFLCMLYESRSSLDQNWMGRKGNKNKKYAVYNTYLDVLWYDFRGCTISTDMKMDDFKLCKNMYDYIWYVCGDVGIRVVIPFVLYNVSRHFYIYIMPILPSSALVTLSGI